MSVELYRANLAYRRQEILIARLRDAIHELADIADSAAISSTSYGHIQARINELRAISQLTPADIGAEFGPNPPGFDPDREIQ
jgi:hypothetical protein